MDSREKILSAAIEVFAEKGKHGARMEEIAERAKVNKAMLYYFYNSRENLYVEALTHIFQILEKEIHQKIDEEIVKTDDPAQQISIIVKYHLQGFSKNIKYTNFLLEAMSTNPDDVRKAVQLCNAHGRPNCGPGEFEKYIEEGIAKGVFRKVNAKQLLISIMGINMIYFLSKPIAQLMLGNEVIDEEQFLKERQESNIDLLLYGLLNKRSA